MTDSLKQQLPIFQQRNIEHLNQWLEKIEIQQQPLTDAMKYALLLGGKRARPYLVYITAKMLGIDSEHADAPAAAVECIHSYSLIHDDLPAMDNDDLRRGHATCHIKFDEATAILAGDALQTLAFEILANGTLAEEAESSRIDMIRVLSKASGASGMCMGQSLDLQAEGQRVDLASLEQIHANKTGALMKSAIQLGALCAGEKGKQILPQLEKYADAIGLAFQVQDDILDITSDTETLGKPQGSDIALEKSTYPALLGLDGAKLKAEQLYQTAITALDDIPYNTDAMQAFAQYVIERKN
ncbi:(2E,6E)-farnesyl diphosphate synthase [Aliivibrio sp. SR45-2]|uniref:(2E,6E)-farnesyl diphosphate synthase n=1 Tax=Aliivibrio sp. SR45-2 TaxID=2760931 RepID=UPI0015FA4955|nr:(2E,6E)-farnesyl diphosphate synthase [Aliivibrio sp. SR45-2]MBB1312777.1 (2E,6E)-farnesyl diphosphate synthase [Aliivibrio sp. SR45-2]